MESSITLRRNVKQEKNNHLVTAHTCDNSKDVTKKKPVNLFKDGDNGNLFKDEDNGSLKKEQMYEYILCGVFRCVHF